MNDTQPSREPLDDKTCRVLRLILTSYMSGHDLSYRQLAAQIGNGVSPQTMSNWVKTGKVDPKFLPALFNLIPVPAEIRRGIMANRLGVDPVALDHAVGLSTGGPMSVEADSHPPSSPVHHSPAATLLGLVDLAARYRLARERAEIDDLNDKVEERLSALRKEHGAKAIPKPPAILQAEADAKRRALGEVLGHEPPPPGPGADISTPMLYESEAWDIEPPDAEEVRTELDRFLDRFPLLWQLSPAIRYVWMVDGMVVGAGRTLEEARTDAELALDMTGQDGGEEGRDPEIDEFPGTPVMVLTMSAAEKDDVAAVRSHHDLLDNLGLDVLMSGTERRARTWELYFERKREQVDAKPPSFLRVQELRGRLDEPPIAPGALSDLATFNAWVSDEVNWRHASSDPHDMDAYVRFVPGRGREVYKVMCTVDAAGEERFKHLSIQYIDPEGRMLENELTPLFPTLCAIAGCFGITPDQVSYCSRLVQRNTGRAVSIIVSLDQLDTSANAVAEAMARGQEEG